MQTGHLDFNQHYAVLPLDISVSHTQHCWHDHLPQPPLITSLQLVEASTNSNENDRKKRRKQDYCGNRVTVSYSASGALHTALCKYECKYNNNNNP